MQITPCNIVAALCKGIAVKCVTVSMISFGRQTEGNDDKTYQLVGDAYTQAEVTRVPVHMCMPPTRCYCETRGEERKTG